MSKNKKEKVTFWKRIQKTLLNNQYQRMKELKDVELDEYTSVYLLKNTVAPMLGKF